MPVSSFHYGRFKISVFDSLDKALKKKWEQIDPGTLSTEYLLFIEETKPFDLSFRYVIVENAGDTDSKIIAKLYFQYLKFTSKNINLDNSFFLNLAARLLLRLRPFYFLICGNLFAVNFPSVSFNADQIKPGEILNLLKQLEDHLKADVYILKDMDRQFTAEFMKGFGWNKYQDDVTMTLDVKPEWKSLSDYKNSLTKDYRKRVEKIIKAGNLLERKELDADEIKTHEKKINELFEQVATRQIIRMGLIKPDYFFEFRKRFTNDFTLIGYYLNGEMVGFTTYIQHGLILETHYIGIDYRYNKSHLIYFNILVDALEKAIKQGNVLLELGRTAREAKANLGAKPVAFNDYVHIKNSLAGILIKIVTEYFQRSIGRHWQERHPFKKK